MKTALLFDQWSQRIQGLAQQHPLQLISWEATRRCDLNCLHCGSPREGVDIKSELSTEEIVNAFRQIAVDFDMSQFHHINITGGEPFVRKDLIEVLGRISDLPFYRNTDIQTNGMVLSRKPELFRELKKVGVTGLGISIDGLEETHDRFRRKKGSFSKAFAAAKLAVESGYFVTVSTVAHSKNVDELSDLFSIVKKEIRPRVFRVMTLDPIGRTKVDSEYLPSPIQLRKVISFLKQEYERKCASYADEGTTMVELGCGGWMGTKLEGTFRPFIFHCIAGINNLGILYDGKLASCSNISRDFVEGDLREERIIEVWNNRYQRYRDFDSKKVGACVSCGEWDYCHGGPMHKRRGDGTAIECLYQNYEKSELDFKPKGFLRGNQ